MVARNLDIEIMRLYPRDRGIETIKQKQNAKLKHNFKNGNRNQKRNYSISND